jgi:hypothetical protein
MKPSPVTMHRLVTFRLLKLDQNGHKNHSYRRGKKSKAILNPSSANEEDSDAYIEQQLDNDDQDYDDYDRKTNAMHAVNTRNVVDTADDDDEENVWDHFSVGETGDFASIVSFVQEWHNMTGVVPFGKTLISLFEYCAVNEEDVNLRYEWQRLMRWALKLPLEPATKVYIDKLSERQPWAKYG